MASFIKLTGRQGNPVWFAIDKIVTIFRDEEPGRTDDGVHYTILEGHDEDRWKVHETPEEILAQIEAARKP